MTILFDMRNLTPVEREVWYDALINRVFHYDQKINTLLKPSSGRAPPASPI